MLVNLRIKNFALIDELEISPGDGLNILTGETGAGKSIVVDALSLSLGERASNEMIRTGAESATVEAAFDISGSREVRRILEDYGIEVGDDNLVVIRREIDRSGRSKCTVNGNTVALFMLRNITDSLVDIHGQHEHQAIFKVRRHIEFLDDFGGLRELKEEYSALYAKFKGVQREMEELMADEDAKERRAEALRQQIEEIRAANLEAGEEERLANERTILGNAEELKESMGRVYSALYEGEGEIPSVLDSLATIGEDLNGVADIDPTVRSLADRLEEARYILDDIATSAASYLDSIEADPNRLSEVEERIALINRLKRKYGMTIEAILEIQKNLERELENIEHSEERLKALSKELEELRAKIKERALVLSEARREAAKNLKKRVERELADLGMERTIFEAKISAEEHPEGEIVLDGKRYKLDSNGIDRVEFMISPNVGEELKPLQKIASGGEISRIMLALKAILASVDEIPTMVFDEVDNGIGGSVAEVVGRKLAYIARNKQIICITHLPQIAALGEDHFKAQKHIEGDRTRVSLEHLKGEERVAEIARMLGGIEMTEITMQHAKEMLGGRKANFA